MGEFINDAGSSETSGCFTPDGKKFYFASDRPTGFGGLDIYVAELNQFGEWGNAENLGPEINSAGDEDAPFLVHDSLLYFSSNGHPGLGNYDIFKAIRVKKKWQKPENLGYPINTAEYENFFHVAADGKHGYYTSVRQEGTGRSDICEFTWLEPEPIVAELEQEKIEEPETSKPSEMSDAFVDPLVSLQKDLGITTTLKGIVIDENSSSPLRAQIILINNETNTVVARVYSNAQTGAFNLDIPHGGNYGLNTSANGYLFNSMNFEVPTFSEHVEIDTHILMVKAQAGSKITLKNVFFDSGKSDLKNESVAELSRLAELLHGNPTLRIQVNGHTDSAGDNASNKALSLRRAQAVISFLQKNGIDVNRLKAVGYGEERPLVSNDDETGGREINRRTELEIIGN
jgi:outer membrane protein OmpA-like peptidoglycan-associated protein